MKTILSLPTLMLLVGLLAINAGTLAQASPQLGGQCSYCHIDDRPDALAITGFDEILEEVKVFDVAPGGSVDLGIDVIDPGAPVYRTVLRGLDYLNGVDENGSPHYSPLQYTPDPSWETKSPGGFQYLYWEGQFYGQGRTVDPESYNFHLEISPDVQPGLYDLTAVVAGGFPFRTPGQLPPGGWSNSESFQLRVIPEPTSLALLLGGGALFCVGSWRRKRAASVVLVVVAGLLMADVSHAYPSRSGDCAVCHSINGPNTLTGDFEISDAVGDPTNNYTVEAGTSTEFQFDVTRLLEDHLAPGTFRRGYFAISGLDLLNVAPGAFEDIPYTASKYTVDHDLWHSARGDHFYIGPTGQYYTQSTTDPAASLPFPLEIDATVEPGIYEIVAKLAGGRPTDPEYLNGWTVTKYFTLTVLPTTGPGSDLVPEPGTFLLLVSAVPMLWLGRRRRG